MLAPLAVVVLWLGVHPTSFSDLFDAELSAYAQQHLPPQHMTELLRRDLALL